MSQVFRRPGKAVWIAASLGASFLMMASAIDAEVWPRYSEDVTIPIRGLDRPAYDAPGILEGAFLVHAGLSETFAGDNNVFASPGPRESDFISTTEESVSADSQWSEHALSARLFTKQQYYAGHKTENADIYGAVASARVDIGSASSLEVDGNFLQAPQARNSVEADIHAVERPMLNTYVGSVSFLTHYGRWIDLVQVAAQDVVFLAHRDASRSGTRHTVTEQLSYALSDRLSVGIEGATEIQDWLVRPDERNFHSLSVLAGLRAEEPTIWLGEIGAGFVRQSFADPAFKTLVTPAAKGRFVWNLDPLTSVVADASRRATGTETFCDAVTGICQSGSGASVTTPFSFSTQLNTLEITSADIAAQREVQHDLLGEVGFKYERDVFDFNNLIDDNYAAHATARYFLNEHVEMDANYTYTQRTATLPNDRTYNTGPYKEHVLSLTVAATL